MPRSLRKEGKHFQPQLILLDAENYLGRAVISDMHLHCCNIDKMIAMIFKKGYFIVNARKILKEQQLTCKACLILRKTRLQAIMGDTHAFQCFNEKVSVMQVANLDLLGPVKMAVTRNITKPLHIMVLSCLYSRYTVFLPLEDASADSILMGLKTCGFMLGQSPCSVVYSDSAQSFISLKKLQDNEDITENQNVDKSDIQFNALKRLLHHNGILLKNNIPRSSWRNSISESQVANFKRNLKRSNLSKKRFNLNQWYYIAFKIMYYVNSRPLSTTYMNEHFQTVSSIDLVYGSTKNKMPDPDTFYQNDVLFAKVKAVDEDLDQFFDLYSTTYLQELAKFRKFKTQGITLQKGDICLIADKINKNTKQPTLATIVEKLSDRSYILSYNKKDPKICEKTYKIIQGAKKCQIKRPAQQIVFITRGKCENENLEYFEDDVNDELFDENDETEDVYEEYFNQNIPLDEEAENEIDANENDDIHSNPQAENEVVENIPNDTLIAASNDEHDDTNQSKEDDDSGKSNVNNTVSTLVEKKPKMKISVITKTKAIKDLPQQKRK